MKKKHLIPTLAAIIVMSPSLLATPALGICFTIECKVEKAQQKLDGAKNALQVTKVIHEQVITGGEMKKAELLNLRENNDRRRKAIAEFRQKLVEKGK